MKFEKETSKLQFFICTNEPLQSNKCGGKGAQELKSSISDFISSQGLTDQVKVTESGCLGFCSKGIAGVIYPKSQWVTLMKLSNLKAVKQMLLKKLTN